MNLDLDTHTRDIWIALGTLSGVGLIISFLRTWTWYSKSGKEIVDLPVRVYFSFIYIYLHTDHFFWFIDTW